MKDDPESQTLLFQLALLIVLTLINAFFAAAEIAIVSLNKNRMEQKALDGDKKAAKIVQMMKDPSNFLSTIQVGITLMTLLSGASLAESLAVRIAPLLGGGKVALQAANVIALVLLTYISIVFGELYPKRIALSKSEEVARIVMGPIKTIGTIAKPFVWLLSASTDLIGKLTPMKFDDVDTKMTREEMRYLLANEGVFEGEELEMLEGVFSLDTKVAREVMVPRTDAFMIDLHDPIEENIDKVLAENFSRIPVFDEDRDKIVGVLHLKNLLKAAHREGFDHLAIQDLLQEPLFVPETIVINDLLVELKRTQNQMAILLDEYGGVVGLATLEDLLEEIVGEIDDESDEVEKLFSQVDEHTYYVQGRMLISDFNQQFETNLEMDDVDTMAGYLITALGTIPDEGQKLAYDIENMTLVSEEMEGTRLLLLKVEFHEPVESETEEESED